MLEREHYDWFIFGHRHLPMNLEIGPRSRYLNLGDWISYFTYAVFDGTTLRLMKRMSDGPLSGDVVTAGTTS